MIKKILFIIIFGAVLILWTWGVFIMWSDTEMPIFGCLFFTGFGLVGMNAFYKFLKNIFV